MKLKPYPKYMPSGVEWLGDLPSHWGALPFKWEIERNDGGVWGVDPVEDEGSIVLRSTEQTVDGNWQIDDPARRALSESDRAAALLVEGDLLLTKSSGSSLHIGKTTLVDAEVAALECCFSNFMQRIRTRPSFLPRLAWYVMNNRLARLQFDFLSNSTTGLANLNGTMIGQLVVTVPPLAEQVSIVSFLDRETAKIDTLIAKQEKLIELLQEKRQAVISHAVTKGLDPTVSMRPSGVEWLGDVPAHWSITKLKYATCLVVDCPHETPIYDPDGDFVVIRTADVSLGVLDLTNSYRLNEDEYIKRTRRSELHHEDIVYGREGERWGFAALVPPHPRTCLGQRMMQFRAAPQTSPSFLMWHLNANAVYSQGELDVVGATSPHVNVETIRNFDLAEPPADEQEVIAEFINREVAKINTLIAKAQQAIELQKEHRTALISAAVTGKIDVRGLVEQDAYGEKAA